MMVHISLVGHIMEETTNSSTSLVTEPVYIELSPETAQNVFNRKIPTKAPGWFKRNAQEAISKNGCTTQVPFSRIIKLVMS